MKQTVRYTIIFFISSLLLIGNVLAQRISFGLYATNGIVLTPSGLGELNFNTKQNVIVRGQTVSINLVDEATAILTITGRLDQEITVNVDAPPTLDLDTTHIPLDVKFAYSNIGATNETSAKQSAIQVPAGFTSVTIPVLRRATGVPAPPPTPDHEGYVPPTGTVYLFLYGKFGPVSNTAAAGLYSGEINIHVEYSVNK